MFELLVESGFAAAHRLREYDGACENLHGHNWKVQVILRSPALNHLGMIMDFRDVKRLLTDTLAQFDHAYLNDLAEFREQNPTTELLARDIFQKLAGALSDPVRVARVTVWESERCASSYVAPTEPAPGEQT